MPRKNYFPLVLVLVIISFALFFFFVKSRQSARQAQPGAEPREEIVRSSHDQRLQKFSLTGFDDKGQKFWNLEGDTAKIDLGDTVFLEDNVTLKLKNDTVIKTDHVRWTQDKGILRTNSPVFVTRDSTRIRGMGAYGRLHENFIQINRDIEMIVQPGTLLTCLGPMKIFYNENRMVYFRHVTVTDAKGTLTSNRMDVYFDPDEKRVREIVALGDVVIDRGSDTTRAERAIYLPATGSIRLEGSPEITLHKGSAELLHAPAAN